jgi:hypothetical protein
LALVGGAIAAAPVDGPGDGDVDGPGATWVELGVLPAGVGTGDVGVGVASDAAAAASVEGTAGAAAVGAVAADAAVPSDVGVGVGVDEIVEVVPVELLEPLASAMLVAVTTAPLPVVSAMNDDELG